MSTMMTVINQKAIIAACTEFGARIGEKLGSREGDAFDIALKACLVALESKPILKKKSSAGTSKAVSAEKQAKINELNDKIVALGGSAMEDTGIMEMRKTLKALERNKKAAEKKAVAEAKAIAKAEEKAAKAAAKAEKASKSPKLSKSEYTIRCFPHGDTAEKDNYRGKNGSYLRYAVHKTDRTLVKKNLANWTDKANAKFAELFPEGKDVAKKKIAKKKISKKTISTKTAEQTIADEQAALIAKLVAPAPSVVAVSPVDTPNEETPIATQNNDEVQVVTSANAKGGETKNSCDNPEDATKIEQAKAAAIAIAGKKDEEEEEEEELIEIEDEEEPDFPGEDEVFEFKHEALNEWEEVDFYKDDNNNVWDENMDFVGKHNEDTDELILKEGYEPEE